MFRCEKGSTQMDIKRAGEKQLRDVFDKYASIERDGKKFMTPEDFIVKYLGMYHRDDYNTDTVRLLASVVDTKKNGRISFEDFQDFEGVLAYPDALYQTIFLLFDTGRVGTVNFGDFRTIISKTDNHKKIPVNFDSQFLDMYFGKHKETRIHFCEFTQFMHDLHNEQAVQAFRNADRNGTGFININDFQNIVLETKQHLMTPKLESLLKEVVRKERSSREVSFEYFSAFTSLLEQMELVKSIYLYTTGSNVKKEVPKAQLMRSALIISQMSPLQIEVLYQLCELLHDTKNIVYDDIKEISPQHHVTSMAPEGEVVNRSYLTSILEKIYRFSLGIIAGATGATAVFPIDLVKTRIQNQRTNPKAAGAKYKGYFDCFFKVLKYEGFFGLYRGLLPQVLGVAPEKAIKLTINDSVRDKFYDENGKIEYKYELLAGACAGCSQVVVTNPIEIIKIRLQTAGEVKDGHKVKARELIRDLGISGLYKGVKMCLLRDVTFATIYFSTYANLKKFFADANGYNSPGSLLGAGICAGVPAASLATPADVVKTRIQVIARSGQQTYDKGVIDTAKMIYKQEGGFAFWKGTLARVCRSSPQLGITLFVYELLQRFLYVDFGGKASTGSRQALSQQKQHSEGTHSGANLPDHIGGYSRAVPVFQGMETRFGITLPKFRTSKPPEDD